MKRMLPLWLVLAIIQLIGSIHPAAAASEVAVQPVKPGGAARAADPAAQMLRSITNASGVAVCVGWSDGALPARLAGKSNLILHILVRDAAGVDAARRFLDSRGLTGRASAELWTSPALPYPDLFANLVILEDPSAVPAAERLRVLAPGGAAWSRREGAWRMERKPRPETFDEWTHWRHGADGNMVSGDVAVNVPAGVRWIASPPPWIVDNTGNSDLGMVTAGGRNFYNLKETLTARDAYNGALLWSRELGIPTHQELAVVKLPKKNPGKRVSRVQPVVVGDALYVVSGADILQLDAATGATRRTLGSVTEPYDMLAEGGRLVVSGAEGLCAYDLATGSRAWESPVQTRRIVAGDGALFCVAGQQAVSLDLANGRERWRSRDADAGKAGTYTYHDGVLVLEQSTLLFKFEPTGCALMALSARDGSTLWKKKYSPKMTHNIESRALFAQGLIWVNGRIGADQQLFGLDPQTGEIRKQWGGSGGFHCTAPLATERFLIAPECNFTDLATGQTAIARMARHACRIPYIPANGLLYTFPLQCECYPLLRGLMGLTPVRTAGVETGAPLRTAAAPPATPAATSAADEWPIYRHDSYRSGSTTSTAPAGELRARWKAPVVTPAEGPFGEEWRANPFSPGALTSPVAAGGVIVVAAPDVHRVIALDAATGAVRWRFTAGGRVDTPPTLHAGMCLFGAHDGWVYGLNAANGALVWQFRAAPREARIVAYGQVESLWPVVGSVLVEGDVAYAVAGRHPMSDGGVQVCALRPRTGELLWKQTVSDLPLTRWYGGKLPSNIKIGKDFKPVDMLVRDGDRLAMSRWRFDPASGAPQAEMDRVDYQAASLRAPLGLWNYGSAQKKYPLEEPATSVFDASGVDAGKPGEVALLRAGGLRLAVTSDGELKTADRTIFKLASPAVHDGMIEAYGRLYVATQNGELVCLESGAPETK